MLMNIAHLQDVEVQVKYYFDIMMLLLALRGGDVPWATVSSLYHSGHQFLTLEEHGIISIYQHSLGYLSQPVIGHGDLIISKRRDLLNRLLLVYDGDRQAPPGFSKSFQRFGLASDPSRWLTRHISYRYPT